MKKILFSILVISLCSCKIQQEADTRFGDQHVKTAIALIELHNIRFGSYPKSLQELQFIGDWDMLALTSVRYNKTEKGYTLKVGIGWVGKPELYYPDEFWQGLGIESRNIN
jgi:hypothetical protein